jgi:hypothetical protein
MIITRTREATKNGGTYTTICCDGATTTTTRKEIESYICCNSITYLQCVLRVVLFLQMPACSSVGCLLTSQTLTYFSCRAADAWLRSCTRGERAPFWLRMRCDSRMHGSQRSWTYIVQAFAAAKYHRSGRSQELCLTTHAWDSQDCHQLYHVSGTHSPCRMLTLPKRYHAEAFTVAASHTSHEFYATC